MTCGPGAGPPSSMPPAPGSRGEWATSATSVAWPAGRAGSERVCASSTRCTPPSRTIRRPARITRRAAASGTRCTCGSRRSPGAGDAGDGRFALAALAAEGRALNRDRRIDRDHVWKLKGTALEHLWARFSASGGDPAFDAFCADQGEALSGFATHCALTERFPGAWADWPEEYRRPHSPAVERFAEEHADRVGYHRWLQWLTESQLAAAGEGLDLMQDLAVGVDPGGADAWLWQDTMALGARVGAPPD